jgi:hypothetical protein
MNLTDVYYETNHTRNITLHTTVISFFTFHKIFIVSSNVRRKDKFVNLLMYEAIERTETARLWNLVIIGFLGYLRFRFYSILYVMLNWWRWAWIVSGHVFGKRLSCHWDVVWKCYWHSRNQKVKTKITIFCGVMCCGTIRPQPLRPIPWKLKL